MCCYVHKTGLNWQNLKIKSPDLSRLSGSHCTYVHTVMASAHFHLPLHIPRHRRKRKSAAMLMSPHPSSSPSYSPWKKDLRLWLLGFLLAFLALCPDSGRGEERREAGRDRFHKNIQSPSPASPPLSIPRISALLHHNVSFCSFSLSS